MLTIIMNTALRVLWKNSSNFNKHVVKLLLNDANVFALDILQQATKLNTTKIIANLLFNQNKPIYLLNGFIISMMLYFNTNSTKWSI